MKIPGLQKLKNIFHLYQARKAQKKFAQPQLQLVNLGITGTDGKTTTTGIVYHILQNSGLKSGYLSSTAAKIGKKELDTGFHVTSPDPWMVPQYLRMMLDEGVEYAVLETTSQGLDQNRFGDIRFDGAIITNIREDHLDYHGTWENYAKAKFRLVEKLKPGGVVILNAEDERSAKWLYERVGKTKKDISFSWGKMDMIQNATLGIAKTSFEYQGVKFNIPVIGADYNLMNILQAIMLTEKIVGLEQISKALSTYKYPSGRMEVILTDPINVIVDFAHTPGSLDAALSSLRKVVGKNSKIITVFGCAGKRDKGRRKMGAVSARHSDITILTAEDPRSETVEDINSEIISLAKKEGAEAVSRFKNHDDYSLTGLGELHAMFANSWNKQIHPILAFDENNVNSRIDAIEMALRLARRGDVVFITGKGHEQSLAFGKEEKEFKWDDRVQTREALKRLKITETRKG